MSADRTTNPATKFDVVRLEDRLNPVGLPAADAFLSFAPNPVLDVSTAGTTAPTPAVSLASSVPVAITPAATPAPTVASSQYQLTVSQAATDAPVADASNGRVAMFTLVPPPPPAQLSGFVYVDEGANGGIRDDGIKQAGEPGIAGTVITLVRTVSGTPVSTLTTTTDSTGFYQFTSLSTLGTYVLTEVQQPSGYLDGKDAIGTQGGLTGNETLTNITLTAGASGINNNFGELLPPPPPAVGSLSGYVYVDEGANGGTRDDGVRQSGEAVIPGTTVTLFRVQGNTTTSVGQTVTDGNGFYQFGNLTAGTYEVRETQPAGFVDGKDTFGTTGGVTPQNDTIVSIPLAAGQNSLNNNFGELLPPPPPPEMGALNGYVYVDANNDGLRQSSEAVIPGTPVTLFRVVGGVPTSIAQTTTNAGGFYQFTSLTAGGGYRVVESQPASYQDGKDTFGSTGGSTAVNDTIDAIAVPAGGVSADNNFGERLGQLSGFVYVDEGAGGGTRNDGIKQAGEPGISGVALTLFRVVGGVPTSVGQTVTDGNGFYQFGNLQAGTYEVRETQPASYTDGKEAPDAGNGATNPSNDVISTITLGGNFDFDSANNNFGELIPPPPPPETGALSGFVYVDEGAGGGTRNDGVKQAGEPGIPNTPVTLFRVVGGVPTSIAQTTTDANGFYRFANLPAGSGYIVRETQPASFTDGKDSFGSTGGVNSANDELSAIPVPAGGESFNNNFGELIPPPPPPQPGALSGYVYVDTNDNGIKESGEAAIPGTTVLLRARDGLGGTTVVAAATTDANGFYRFAGLAPDNYWVQEVQPGGFVDGKDTFGSTGGVVQVNDQISAVPVPAGGESFNNNFGELLPPVPPAPGALSGFVYVDTNDNGVKESGEAAIPGATVLLRARDGLGGTTVVAAATTDANGFYRFAGLAPDNYWVQEVQPGGFVDGKDTFGSTGGVVQVNDQISAVPVPAGGESFNNNFGELLPPVPPAPGALSGFVYVDTNDNGVKESGEAAIPGTVVLLRARDGLGGTTVIASATTDAAGFYRFAGLAPDNYWVQEVQPGGFVDGKDTFGSTGGVVQVNDQISAVPVPAGGESFNNNFGELLPPPPPPQPGALSGYVYADTNDNGVKDPGEAAIPGTTVILRARDGLGGTTAIASATTDANGFYRFSGLTPDQYWVQELQPASFIDGKDTVGSTGGVLQLNDQLSAVPVAAGVESVNNNFGELKCVTLFGFVWFDANKNGTFDSGESGLGGASVTISGTTFGGRTLDTGLTMGNPLTITTDANGRYSFTCLPPGVYSVVQTNTPTGYTDFMQQNASSLAPSGSSSTTFVTFGLTDNNGALNFGKVLQQEVSPPPPVSPQVPLSPVVSKQNFLGSSS